MLRKITLAAILIAAHTACWAQDDAAAARSAWQRGDFASASRGYERASKTAGALAPEYLLSAAEAAVLGRDTIGAENLLNRIVRTQLDASQNARFQLVTSEILLARNQPAQALRSLPADDAGEARLVPRIAAVRSKAQAALANATPAPTPAAALPAAVATPVQSTAVLPSLSASGDRHGYALLLPLSGPFAASAEAIRDGFMTALLGSSQHPSVRIYDTGTSTQSAISAYQLAVNEGAGVVVGPLHKDGVAAVTRLGTLPVPVLALNYLDGNAMMPNLVQFGLAPEDEARAVAERAVSDGLRRAVTLTPSSDWGERVLAAFSARLQELGGSVVSTARYANGETDFSTQVKLLMNLEASEARHKSLSAIIGGSSEFEPRRRSDLDFVFTAAKPGDARLILPQLRFYRASELPVYAPSLVYDAGDTSGDLNGLRFCDMPWMLRTADSGRPRSEAEQWFPATMRESPRLFALGQDAYRVASLMQRGGLQGGSEIAGVTGALSLAANGALTRRLGCAQLQAGVPQILASRSATP